MSDLRTTVAGIALRNPVLLASGPLSYDGAAIVRAYEAGVGAVVTKTICREAARNPIPHIARLPYGLLNSEKWSDVEPSAWIDRELPMAVEAGARVIASVGLDREQVEELAGPVSRTGVDAIEVCSYDGSQIVPMVRVACRGASHVPIVAKVSANWPDVCTIAAACVNAGASGITAIDSVGPALRIDVETARPLVAGGGGWLSGSGVLGIALRVVSDIARMEGRTAIVGTGGVGSADECIEMLMAGASAVGVCSHFLVGGLERVAEMVDGLGKRLEELGYVEVRSVIGAGLPGLEASRQRAQPLPCDTANAVQFRLDRTSCTACGLCVRVCPYGARTTPDRVDRARCRFCGLCTSVCPVDALRLHRPSDCASREGDGT